ncbi:hypothetical protein DFH09DRAFT_1493516, partial [Mycena vulgaris]
RKNATFLKEGNIFVDGQADKYGIPEPIEYGGDSTKGETWCGADRERTSSDQSRHHAKIKRAFKFSSGRRAILVMEKDTISVIDPPGALSRRLLEDPTMRGLVVVSEVHACSAYARLLTAQEGSTIALGLNIEPPVSGVASAAGNATWVRNASSGNFKSQVNKGDRR